ncbi:MAG: hypothetical protein LBH47_02895 [Christensenellaceae bacterium]|jgi:hypothetical protein|nr:hypothetical protein [Christensenellaceae bacterium]
MEENKKPKEAKDIQHEELDKDYVNEEVEDGVHYSYVVNAKGRSAVFPVTIESRPSRFNKDVKEQFFTVKIKENCTLEWPVDDGNKMLVSMLPKNEKLSAKFFAGVKNNRSYIGLEIKLKDGYKLQYSNYINHKQVNGFWMSSGERKAMQLMGYFDLIKQ